MRPGCGAKTLLILVETWRRIMPKLVRLYLRNVALGFLLAVVFVGLILWLNVGNLWHLVTTSPDGALAVGLLVLFNAIVFSGVQFAIAVMRLAEPEDHGGGNAHAPIVTVAPVPAMSRARKVHGASQQ
jgi:hypothetical protein